MPLLIIARHRFRLNSPHTDNFLASPRVRGLSRYKQKVRGIGLWYGREPMSKVMKKHEHGLSAIREGVPCTAHSQWGDMPNLKHKSSMFSRDPLYHWVLLPENG